MAKGRRKEHEVFFRLEKQRYNQKTMNCVIREDGTISKKQRDILKEQANFYQRLYKADTSIEFTFVNKTDVKLSDVEKASLEKDIELEELAKAIKSRKRNKVPGQDGLTAEIFIVLWPKLGHLLLEVFKFSKQNG